jgi:hypothetical protein
VSRVVAFATLLALLLFATLALAQPKGGAEAKQAKALFEEGISLSDNGKWPEALEAFRKSDALVPSASVKFNIGATLRALGRYVEAKNTLEAILKDADSPKSTVKPALKEEVKKVLADVYDKVVMITVKLDPKDADLQIDGADAAPLPDGRFEMDPGRHVFVVSAKGHETTTISRTLTADDTEITLKAPASATPKVVEKRVEVKVAEDTPFYKRFWFWTAAGAVVAGGVVVAVILTRPDAREPAGPPTSSVDRVIPAGVRF